MKILTRQEEQILLVIHRLGESAYLVNIREMLRGMTGRYYDVGTIYVPLKRLDQLGFLRTHLGEPTAQRGGKAIKYYSLTPKGYEALTEVKRIQDRLWENIVFPTA